MEERNGWQRAILAARHFDVTVLYLPSVEQDSLSRQVPMHLTPNAMTLVPICDDRLSHAFKAFEPTFYLSYHHWQRLAFRCAKKLHSKTPFDLTHMVTLCGFREPSLVWKLDVPHIWGPIGGTHNFPLAFLRSLDIGNQIRELFRTAMNHYQLNWCRHVRCAVKKSSIIIAASAAAQKNFQQSFGKVVEHELETGIDYPISAPRNARNGQSPLKILWTGRLRAWKALPILLQAIASLPDSVNVQLRIVGNGKSKTAWMKLATRLGIDHCIEWLPWPDYRETIQHYEWADVFAFTSLRDTSGTGLLEALAAGCPILGVDHQGAADIMTEECAIAVPVESWTAVVNGFRDGVLRLSTDHELWHKLSKGSTARASYFSWNRRSPFMSDLYLKVLKSSHLKPN